MKNSKLPLIASILLLVFSMAALAGAIVMLVTSQNTQYTVTFNLNLDGQDKVPVTLNGAVLDGQDKVPVTVKKGGVVEAPPVSREGYSLSWDQPLPMTVTGPVSVNAVWTRMELAPNQIAERAKEAFMMVSCDNDSVQAVKLEDGRMIMAFTAWAPWAPKKEYKTEDGKTVSIEDIAEYDEAMDLAVVAPKKIDSDSEEAKVPEVGQKVYAVNADGEIVAAHVARMDGCRIFTDTNMEVKKCSVLMNVYGERVGVVNGENSNSAVTLKALDNLHKNDLKEYYWPWDEIETGNEIREYRYCFSNVSKFKGKLVCSYIWEKGKEGEEGEEGQKGYVSTDHEERDCAIGYYYVDEEGEWDAYIRELSEKGFQLMEGETNKQNDEIYSNGIFRLVIRSKEKDGKKMLQIFPMYGQHEVPTDVPRIE